MDINKFDYYLPKNLIANSPATPRDHSRLMVVNRKTKKIEIFKFFEIEKILGKNDVLVFNDTKVFPARIYGINKNGGKREFLLLENTENNIWTALFKGKLNIGEKINFGFCNSKIIKLENNIATMQFNMSYKTLLNKLEDFGEIPLPPYINSPLNKNVVKKRYQTVYAKKKGSVAAPTAGFHFTKSLLNKLQGNGVKFVFVTLHVGLGTFEPVKETDIKKHKIHKEFINLTKKAAFELNKYKKEGKRIISVGTTSARVLESCSDYKGVIYPISSSTSLFIYPPYKFRFVDSLITNFHLPKSTLLTLICAFCCYPNTKYKFNNFSKTTAGTAYSTAISNKMRFYSFGDAMLLI